jgi:hypothetical protein
MRNNLLKRIKEYFEVLKLSGYSKNSSIENILILKFVCDIIYNPDLELYISDKELTTIYNLLEYINLNK